MTIKIDLLTLKVNGSQMQRVITELERPVYEEDDEPESLQRKLKSEKKIIKYARLFNSQCMTEESIKRLRNIQSKSNFDFDILPKDQENIKERKIVSFETI